MPRRGKRSHPGVRAYALGMTWLSFRGSSQPFHYQSGSVRIDRGHYRLTKEKAQPFGRAWWTMMAVCSQSFGLRPHSHRTLPRAKKVSPGHFFAMPTAWPPCSSPISGMPYQKKDHPNGWSFFETVKKRVIARRPTADVAIP